MAGTQLQTWDEITDYIHASVEETDARFRALMVRLQMPAVEQPKSTTPMKSQSQKTKETALEGRSVPTCTPTLMKSQSSQKKKKTALKSARPGVVVDTGAVHVAQVTRALT
jgi:hypothetical protein